MIKHGLNETPEDERDFKLGGLVNIPDPRTLESEFFHEPVTIYNQLADGADDFCSACATDGMSSIQEEVPLFYPLSFAISKEISGDPTAFGQNIRDAMKGHVNRGALAFSDTPDAVKAMSKEDQRYLERYPNRQTLLNLSIPHKKKTFFKISGPYDHYDNIRGTISYFKDKKYTVGFGVKFGWTLDQYLLNNIPVDGEGHMMFFNGWDGDGLGVVNSAGQGAGKNGTHRMERAVVNYFFEKYGGYTFVDITREEAEFYLKNGIKVTDNWVLQLFKRLAATFHL